ncbi:unnamed protein product [Peronospora belbahrii]|uniref:Elicitin-like protein n=1 Tax=Peronospora belbahrii TaxID=622444 RepID=A0ABN8CNC1_9STRA|nr:unnamed protein product [Peronospora belbahrii]
MTSLSALLVVGLAFSTTVRAEMCSTPEWVTISSSPYLQGCTSDVGFGSFVAVSTLTDEKVKAICANSDCVALINDIRTMGFGDCIIPDTDMSLEKDILDPFEEACSAHTSVSSAASASSANSIASAFSISWVSTLAFVVAALALDILDISASADDACTKTDMLGISTSPFIAECMSDVGSRGVAAMSELTPEQVAVVCSSSACKGLIKDIEAMGLDDCKISETSSFDVSEKHENRHY